MIYVWAIEQDELSKRAVSVADQSGDDPELGEDHHSLGQDVFVPWVLTGPAESASKQVFNRYYHMFAEGEVLVLVQEAADTLGLAVESSTASNSLQGIEVVRHGWERSNHYIELRRWSRISCRPCS